MAAVSACPLRVAGRSGPQGAVGRSCKLFLVSWLALHALHATRASRPVRAGPVGLEQVCARWGGGATGRAAAAASPEWGEAVGRCGVCLRRMEWREGRFGWLLSSRRAPGARCTSPSGPPPGGRPAGQRLARALINRPMTRCSPCHDAGARQRPPGPAHGLQGLHSGPSRRPPPAPLHAAAGASAGLQGCLTAAERRNKLMTRS